MWLCYVLLLVLIGLPILSLSQTAGLISTNDKTLVSRQGTVVDEVTKNSAAEKAGLREGDVLLTWSRGDAAGQIDSPFDVSLVAIEQAPRGIVSLKGLRGSEESAWKIGPGPWGLKTRSALQQSVLQSYLEGRKLSQEAKWSEAAKYWQTAAGQLDNSTPISMRLWLFSQAADAFAQARQWKEADDTYQRALQQAGEASPAIRALLLRGWAKAYQQHSDWLNAEKYYQQSTAENEKQGAENLLAAANTDDLGIVARFRGDMAKAESYHRQALEVRQKLAPGSLDFARSLNNLGIVAFEQGNLAKAEQYFHQAQETSQKIDGESLETATSFNELGNIARQRGKLEEAEQDSRQALEITRRLAPGSQQVASILNSLGIIVRLRGDLEKAEQYGREALEIKQKLVPGSLDVSYILNNLGNVELERGDLATAGESYRESLEIKQKLAPGSLSVATTLLNLGSVTRQQGDLAKAEQYYHEALEIEQKLVPGTLNFADLLNNLGNIAWQRGDLVKAARHLQEALEIQQKLAPGSLAVALTFQNLGAVEEERGELVKAEQYAREGLELKQKLAPGSLAVADSLNNLGNLAFDRGEFAQAESYQHQALDIRQKLAPGSLGIADTLDNLGKMASRRGDLATAEQYLQQAVQIRQKLAPRSGPYADSLAALAAVQSRKDESAQATLLYQRAFEVLESQMSLLGGSEETRSAFRSKHLDFYRGYIDLLIRQEQPESAFHVLERSRARGMLETLVAAHVDVRNGIDPALSQQEHLLQESIRAKSERRIRLLSTPHTEDRLTGMDREISDLLSQYQDVEGRIRSASPAYAGLTQPQALNAQQVMPLLDADTVLLEFSLGDEQSHVFLVTSTSLTVYTVPKRLTIETAARQVYEMMTFGDRINGDTPGVASTRRNVHDLNKAGAALSEMLLGPVAGQIKGKRLIVVSDGILEYIPFAALPIPKTTDIAPTPLVVEHEIISLPSASVLAELRRQAQGRRAAPNAVAVLADPVFDKNDERVRSANSAIRGPSVPATPADSTTIASSSSSNAFLTRSISDVGLRAGSKSYLPRLLFTRREARRIIELTPPGKGMAALDFKASRVAMLNPELSQYRIVHIATHGLVNSVNPGLSGLVFSLVNDQGKDQDGFLGLQDIYNLNLNADLVVLSACQTGLGKDIEGEGLVGMTRGFMYAGARRVVTSLWNVVDSATAELMGDFYKAMEQDRMPPAAALRRAQIQMWKQKRWSDPYYWAAFQIQGDWK